MARFDADGQPLAIDPEQETAETGTVFSAATIDDTDASEEPAPLTFEDSLVAQDLETGDDEDTGDTGDTGDDDEDVDKPQQMSLF